MDVAALVSTFRRDSALTGVLTSLEEQTQPPVAVVVVDNAGSDETALLCRRHPFAPSIRYVRAPSNLGPAGGTARAMAEALTLPTRPTWLLRLDDDRPLPSPTFLEDHAARAEALRVEDPRTGAVGRDGASWDWRRARLVARPTDRDPVAVDYLRTNYFPLYLVDMVEEVGSLRAELFFGMTEVEYGLRIQRAGWTQWAVGTDLFLPRDAGPAAGRLDDWRRYYSIRNTVTILREQGRPGAAWRLGLARAVGRPLVSLPRAPRRSLRGLSLGLRALRDARAGRLGMVIDPVEWNRTHHGASADTEMPST